jgi:hypothetical protein
MHSLIEHHTRCKIANWSSSITYIDSDPAFYTSKLAAFDMQIMDCFTGVDTERSEEETGYGYSPAC